MELAEKELKNQQYQQAILYYNQAIAIKEELPEAYLKMMECSIYAKDLTSYKSALLQLENINYDIPTSWYVTFAVIAEEKKQYASALEILQRALNQEPNNVALLLRKVSIFEKTHRTAEKLAILNRLHLQNKDNPFITYKLADAYFYTQPQKSITLYKQLLHEKDYTDIALISLGQLYTNLFEESKDKKDLQSSYNYYKLYANSHPKDATIKKLMKEMKPML